MYSSCTLVCTYTWLNYKPVVFEAWFRGHPQPAAAEIICAESVFPALDVIIHIYNSAWRAHYRVHIFQQRLTHVDHLETHPYELFMKSYHMHELVAPLCNTPTVDISYGRNIIFFSPTGDFLTHFVVATFCGWLVDSSLWRRYTVIVHPQGIETIFLSYECGGKSSLWQTKWWTTVAET